MKGTEKQIKWAEDIKQNVKDMIEDAIENKPERKRIFGFGIGNDSYDKAIAYARKNWPSKDTEGEQKKANRQAQRDYMKEAFKDYAETKVADMMKIDSAVWWIDNRNFIGNFLKSKDDLKTWMEKLGLKER
jgi:hypothetical protein